jgi:hypothetical protein
LRRRAAECRTPFARQQEQGRMGGLKFALPNLSNAKDGTVMATRKFTPEELQAITRLAKQWGKIVVRRAFGEQGPGLDVDLAQMEEVAYAAARGLTAGALEEGTSQQGQQLGEQQPCPQCQRLCPVSPDERPVQAKGGAFQLREPKCHCPTCRRDFFPSASAPEARRTRLQSDDHAQDSVRDL